MAKIIKKGIFPSQAVSSAEKASEQYGLQIGNAIEAEWFRKDGSDTRYFANRDNFHRLRLYARGEQSIDKYKNELSINGDLSYLNLDWKPVPIIPKFVDIVVNGIQERTYDLKAYSVDAVASAERTQYVKDYLEDMRLFSFKEAVEQDMGLDTFKNDKNNLPESDEELELHMQLTYKQSIEIAQEQALTNVFDLNKYDLLKKRLDYDTAVLGISCVKNSFNTAEGIKLQYVDPSDLVYSYTESPYFDDLYYVGEVRKLTIAELKNRPEAHNLINIYSSLSDQTSENVLKEFSGKGFSYFQKVNRAIEVLYEGTKIVGHEKLLEWKKCVNMTRPKSDITKVQMSYNIVAPRIYKGKPESLVSRMTSFADMIQITHLKLQQVLSRLVPDGVYLDADGLAEVDLGNGTNYNPQEALNMYFQTGSVIGRSMTQDGDMNPGRVPIQELQTSGGNNKIASLIQSYNYYLQMMRDVTGLNEARDGSQPDKNALVGLQKLAAANSNTATNQS